MAEDWNPGDLAICMKTGEWICPGDGRTGFTGPERGHTYRVVVFEPAIEGDRCEGAGWLILAEWHFERWDSSRFRKVRPDTEPATDAETIALIKGVGRKVPA
jgi:hypothetical protein